MTFVIGKHCVLCDLRKMALPHTIGQTSEFLKWLSWYCVVNSVEIKSISLQAELAPFYYTEIRLSTYLRSSSRSKMVFRKQRGKNIHCMLRTTQSKLLKLLRIFKVVTWAICVDTGSTTTVRNIYTFYCLRHSKVVISSRLRIFRYGFI